MIYTTIKYYHHKLKDLTQKYLDEFASIENIPLHEIELYELANDLILAESVIESTQHYQMIMNMASDMDLSKTSGKVIY
ncbi:MAG: hypothetical protein C5S45_00615 [Candidatus Methanocomedens sp.]|nr:MAG: hypothetical protein C5S45_00615 [ANME-2 cluster archaeon]